MATQNGSTPDVNASGDPSGNATGLEENDRTTVSGLVLLGYRNDAIREGMGILDMKVSDFVMQAIEEKLAALIGFTPDVEQDAKLDAQLTADRKAYALKLAAKKAAKAA